MGGNSFPKDQRLRGRKKISEVFAEGESGFVYPLRYLFVCREGSGVSVLVSVSKRFHKRAVRRNLLKRRMREAFRTGGVPMKEAAALKGVHIDIALLYSSKEVLDYGRIGDAIEKILARIGQGV